jgi:hypothetical protein
MRQIVIKDVDMMTKEQEDNLIYAIREQNVSFELQDISTIKIQ